jgi:hypothetical protein
MAFRPDYSAYRFYRLNPPRHWVTWLGLTQFFIDYLGLVSFSCDMASHDVMPNELWMILGPLYPNLMKMAYFRNFLRSQGWRWSIIPELHSYPQVTTPPLIKHQLLTPKIVLDGPRFLLFLCSCPWCDRVVVVLSSLMVSLSPWFPGCGEFSLHSGDSLHSTFTSLHSGDLWLHKGFFFRQGILLSWFDVGSPSFVRCSWRSRPRRPGDASSRVVGSFHQSEGIQRVKLNLVFQEFIPSGFRLFGFQGVISF